MNPILLGILKKAPELIVIARQLAEGVREGRRSAAMADRVSLLEQNETRQAELIKDMARQLNDMSAVMKAMNNRVNLCLAGAAVALALAAAALLLAVTG
jgi:hypothetical protein